MSPNLSQYHLHGKKLPKPDLSSSFTNKTASVDDLVNNFRLTPATLYTRLDPQWIPKEFLLYASMEIAKCIAKPGGRLIISWPPRHGKSRLATIATPIWCLENFPHKNIILATYGSDLSTDFGREVRDIMNRNHHILKERIRADVKSVGRFMTTKGGGMLNVGLGGGITGKGADVMLIDDYIKTMEEARNMKTHEKHWEWFTGTAYHRLEPGASLIIIATRWHTQDLIGRIKREFPEWKHIEFTATAEKDDVLNREIGEPLFPERYDVPALRDIKRVIGTFYYNAIYQQRPVDDDNQLTDRTWIDIVDIVPTHNRLKYARIWDFAGTKGGGDYTVSGLIAVDMKTRHCYIIDMFRRQVSPHTIEANVALKAETDGTDVEVILEQEPGASGKQVYEHYRDNVLPDYKVTGSPTTTSKVIRAQPFLAAAESGKVHILNRSWNKEFLDEFEDFPDGINDDQIDVCSIGYNTLLGDKAVSATWGRRKKALANKDVQEKGKSHHSKAIQGSTWGRRRSGQGITRVPGLNSPEIAKYVRPSQMNAHPEVEDAIIIEDNEND